MKYLICLIYFVLILCKANSQDTFQLAPPLFKYNSVFFQKQVTVALIFAMPGIKIHYTLNGKTPGLKDAVYISPVIINQNNTVLKAKVFSAGFLPSETVETRFYKKGFPIRFINTSPATAPYTGDASKLTDGIGGMASPAAGSWLGYQTDTVELIAGFAKAKKISAAFMHLLQDQNSWIFLPVQVNVYSRKAQTREWVMTAQAPVLYDENIKETKCVGLQVPLQNPVTAKEVKLQLISLKSIPDWHPGRGAKGWIFIDEINFY